ncbi:exodeoxyribonuclease V subunit alpha [Nocardioides sambongensis]|uniref:exodeoxyribonuclease V subunit alpha n=1 Tax=Nocardioides sambongensis TaxID=2589074 RepID=UPI0015E861D6|nr:exodeoxyribonuclease V subunit alpha [Nocardioides sambongensis]
MSSEVAGTAERSTYDARVAVGASGTFAALNLAGVLDAADIRVAQRVGALGEETDQSVLLAVALAVRAVRLGSVGVDLRRVCEIALPDGVVLPDAAEWVAAVEASPLTAAGVIHHELDLVSLDRYHRLERQVADDLLTRMAADAPAVDADVLATTRQRVAGPHFSDEQGSAVDHAVRHRTTVLTGGPGTGKTTTVARIVVALADQFAAEQVRRQGGEPVAGGRHFSVALAAPTGKAATRLQEAVNAELTALGIDSADAGRPEASTLHRLLGWRPDNTTRFVHDRSYRLKQDLIVVDEASMVDLTLMARLLEAVRPETRLVLVGDPGQLTSVGAGAVLSDLVAGFADHADSPVVALQHNHRSTEEIKALAQALRDGDPDEVLAVLRRGSAEVEYVETDDPAAVLRPACTAAAVRVHAAATGEGAPTARAAAALEALEGFRLLCAHRQGPYGVRHWNRQVETWLAEELGQPLGGVYYPGRPLLVTANDYTLDVYNGETGVVVLDDDGRRRAWIAGVGAPRAFAPGRLDAIDTMHAMTIHKSQGSQAETVTVLLPDADSRLLTRELFYTAVTRAKSRLRVVGSEEAVRAAVATTAQRATSLRQRLHPR